MTRRDRIYVACAYSMRGVARAAARSIGLERVVSGWHEAPEQDEHALDDAARRALWRTNMSDLEGADAVFVPTALGGPRTTWAEVGIATANGVPVVVVADAPLPLVCYAPSVVRVATLEELEEAFRWLYGDGEA